MTNKELITHLRTRLDEEQTKVRELAGLLRAARSLLPSKEQALCALIDHAVKEHLPEKVRSKRDEARGTG